MKLCECGCGQPAPISKHTNRRRGYVTGEPVRFIAGHNNRPGVPKSPETRQRMREAWAGRPRPWMRGPRPGAWKEGEVSSAAAHSFLSNHFPRKGVCEECGRRAKTDYSFQRHPEPYTRNREDYRELCRSCHVLLDIELGVRPKWQPGEHPNAERCRAWHGVTYDADVRARDRDEEAA
jgi:hypothetical protein